LRSPDAAHGTVIDNFLYKGSQARYPTLLSYGGTSGGDTLLSYAILLTRKYNRTLYADFNIFDSIDSTAHAKHSDSVKVRRAFIYCAFPVCQATILH